jgi:hypothetical protein
LNPFNNERLEIGAGGVNRGSETGGAGAENDETVVTFFLHAVSVTESDPKTKE